MSEICKNRDAEISKFQKIASQNSQENTVPEPLF